MGKSTIDGPFSIVMLHYQRVRWNHPILKIHISTYIYIYTVNNYRYNVDINRCQSIHDIYIYIHTPINTHICIYYIYTVINNVVNTIVNHPHNHHKWVVQNIPSHGWFMIVLTTLHDILCTLNHKPYLYIYNILYIPYVYIYISIYHTYFSNII